MRDVGWPDEVLAVRDRLIGSFVARGYDHAHFVRCHLHGFGLKSVWHLGAGASTHELTFELVTSTWRIDGAEISFEDALEIAGDWCQH